MRIVSHSSIAAAVVALSGSAFAAQANRPPSRAAGKPAKGGEGDGHYGHGTVSKFDAASNTLTVTTPKGDVAFMVDSSASVTANGKKVMARDLPSHVGHKVTVRYTESGGQKMAQSVRVTMAAPKTASMKKTGRRRSRKAGRLRARAPGFGLEPFPESGVYTGTLAGWFAKNSACTARTAVRNLIGRDHARHRHLRRADAIDVDAFARQRREHPAGQARRGRQPRADDRNRRHALLHHAVGGEPLLLPFRHQLRRLVCEIFFDDERDARAVIGGRALDDQADVDVLGGDVLENLRRDAGLVGHVEQRDLRNFLVARHADDFRLLPWSWLLHESTCLPSDESSSARGWESCTTCRSRPRAGAAPWRRSTPSRSLLRR